MAYPTDRGFRQLNPPVILGRGASGVATVVQDEDGFKYVQKEFSSLYELSDDSSDQLDGRDMRTIFRVESTMLRRVAGCPNVQQILDYWTCQDLNGNDTYYIISEYYVGRTASRLVNVSQYDMARFMVQIFVALCAIHAQGVAHMDNHLGNIVTDSNGDFILIDFSAAVDAEPNVVIADWVKFAMGVEYLMMTSCVAPIDSVFRKRVSELSETPMRALIRTLFNTREWKTLEAAIGSSIMAALHALTDFEGRDFLQNLILVGMTEYLVLGERRGFVR